MSLNIIGECLIDIIFDRNMMDNSTFNLRNEWRTDQFILLKNINKQIFVQDTTSIQQ